MKILFVRHGESVDDIEDRYGGWADYDLTEKGRMQAAECAGKITSLNENFEIVLSSPLKRAFQAAEIISNRIGLETEVFDYLKERNLNGILTGLVRSEAKEKYPDLVQKHSNYEYVHGSEREEDFDERVRVAMDLMKDMPYDSLVVVTHGLFLKALFREMMRIDITKVGNGGFALVEEVGKTFKIIEEEGINYT
ncbi:hypothetical protein GF389_01955 [Candidatus Dojkabacteria bacterium]|nr:hypothetical protein [Candidatus Dojkabacteria bacterium]